MLSFLYVTAKAGFNAASYTDEAVGEMTTTPDGKQWVSKITLDPQIEWTGDKLPSEDDITEIHHEAHKICFIANSIRSEVVIRNANPRGQT
jgi:organic hydroperoxide reductase OsmC/OhrA